jgi:hypothetical protein
VAYLEESGPVGPEKLIKMATGQLLDASGMRPQPPRDTCESNNAWDYRARAGLGPNAASRSCEVPVRRGR